MVPYLFFIWLHFYFVPLLSFLFVASVNLLDLVVSCDKSLTLMFFLLIDMILELTQLVLDLAKGIDKGIDSYKCILGLVNESCKLLMNHVEERLYIGITK